jgi:hypothetical protein
LKIKITIKTNGKQHNDERTAGLADGRLIGADPYLSLAIQEQIALPLGANRAGNLKGIGEM